ncbi:MAG TPA: hypothetical protein VGK74_13130 [Symbiobacteriaceae bacterium]|jgi:hypothetical protein
MNRFAAYRELRELLIPAVAELGESRVALLAGCHRCSVTTWLQRSNGQLFTRTIEHTLPRVRTWQMWLPGYLAARAELERLQAAGPDAWEQQLAELQSLIGEALSRYSPYEVALGCEVSSDRLALWRKGDCREEHTAEALQALAHLRHLDAWPPTRSRQLLLEPA